MSKKHKDIIWSSVRKNKNGLMGSKTRVHKDTKQNKLDKIHKKEIDE